MILGLESSCDETAVAVFDPARGIVGEWVHSQIALHEVYGGEESRLPKQIRPRIGHLHLQLVCFATEREFLERGRTFTEKDVHERAVRPIRKAHFNRHHAQLLHGL